MEEVRGQVRVKSSADLGRLVRDKRRKDGLTQVEAAALCGIGTRFLSDLENGKPTIELGKVLQVVQGLGLELRIEPRGWPERGA